jgi:hypothetical protein
MNTAYVDTRASASAGAFGGLMDAIGGIAAAVIAIVGLTGFQPEMMTAIAVIVFGAAMLIQGGTLLSEYTGAMQVVPAATEGGGEGATAAMFLAGAAGMVLGILALLGIAAAALTAVAILVFGAALLLSSSAVRRLFMLQTPPRPATARSATEMLAGEMASGSAGIQLAAGLTAIVLGILALAGIRPQTLMLAALIVLGVTFIVTGSTLSGIVMGFMRETRPRPS